MLDLVVDVIYCVDIRIRWLSYYFNAKGDLVQEPELRRRHYVRSTKLSHAFGVDALTVASALVVRAARAAPSINISGRGVGWGGAGREGAPRLTECARAVRWAVSACRRGCCCSGRGGASS